MIESHILMNDSATSEKIMLCESEGIADKYNRNIKIIDLNLDVFSEPMHLRIGATDEQAKLTDIVPLAQAVSTKIAQITAEKNQRNGVEITCRKGCDACCRHYLVPLSVPEALKIMDTIFLRPEPQRKQILWSFLLASQRILKQKLPKIFLQKTQMNLPGNAAFLREISNWYTNLKIFCPFLSEGVCTIYAYRPVACRDYFACGSADECWGGNDVKNKVEMSIQMVEILGQLASELEDTSIEAVMLPLVPAWYELNPDRGKQTWPATMIVERFVEIIKSTSRPRNPTLHQLLS